MVPKSASVSLSSLHRRRYGDIRDWIVPQRLEPVKNNNLQQLYPWNSVSAEQMVLFDIDNGPLGFSESSCEYQDLRHRVGEPSLAMGCIITVELLECDEEGGDEVRGHTRLVVILHI